MLVRQGRKLEQDSIIIKVQTGPIKKTLIIAVTFS